MPIVSTASVSISELPGTGIVGIIEVPVVGTPFKVKVPTTLTTRNGDVLVLQTHVGGCGYNSFRWICKDIADPACTQQQGCFFQNTTDGRKSFEMYLDGVCAHHNLKKSDTYFSF
jgi:hypothetical protein